MGRGNSSRRSKSSRRRRERSPDVEPERWDYNTGYIPTPVYNLAALPYPTSASYPLMDDNTYQQRSPSRPMTVYSGPSDFVSDFLGKSGGNEQYPMVAPPAYSPMLADAYQNQFVSGETPEFGPNEPTTVVPNVVRKSTTGIFKVLESAMPSLFPIPVNTQTLVSDIASDPLALNTQMWSGVLTNTGRDRYYRVHLSGMEKVLRTIVDETLRKLRDDLNAPQLSVFLRRIWNTAFPVSGKKVEKFIVDYDTEKSKYFNGSTTVLEDNDQARIVQLDNQIAAAEAEIAAWHKLLASGDTMLTNFRAMKSNFFKEINRIDSSSVSLSVIRSNLSSGELASNGKIFVEGGSMGIPELPDWEHPEIRAKKNLLDKFTKDMDEIFGSTGMHSVPKGCGIPPGSFCFDPAAEIDDTWMTPPYEEWEAQLVGEPPSITPLQSPLSVASAEHVPRKSGGSHRLSIDALRAFAQ